MSIPPLTDLIDFVSEHLLNGLILSAGIFVGAVVLLPLCFRANRWSAATRHRVSLLTFVFLAATPLLVVLKPAHRSAVTPKVQPATNYVAAKNISISPLVGRIHDPINVERKAPSIARPAWLEKVDWPAFLFVGWAAISFVCVFRLAGALYRLKILHSSARPVALPEQLSSSRPVNIAESPLVSSPVAIGLWSAKVLLPVGFQSKFSVTERHNVLLHEVAHLERFDDWSTFIQQGLLAVFPINPFLWATSRISQLHQEAACDDRVLAETHQAKSYAHLLARLADGNTERSILASGVSRQGKQLYQRLTRILDGTRDRNVRPSSRNVIAAAIGLLGASVAGLIWLPAVVWTSTVRASEPQIVVSTNGPGPARSSLDPEIVALLTNSALNDPDPSVRQEATLALSEHEGNDITTAILTLFTESKDEQVKLTILHRMSPKRAADPRIKDKLNDLALHETSIPIRTAAIDLLAKRLDDAGISQLIAIYRAANGLPIKVACLRGLGATDSKTAKDFLMSIAKEDPDPQLRCVALRAIADQRTPVEEFVVNGKHIQLAQDQLRQQMDAYRKDLDTLKSLNEESGTFTFRRALPDAAIPPVEKRFFYLSPGPEEEVGPHPEEPPFGRKQFPEEHRVDPSPKPSPSVNE